jgi:basic amino acid/polyamine antiporter, APA family
MQTTRPPGPQRPKCNLWNRIFERRAPDALIEEANRPGKKLNKTLGTIDLVAFGIGAIIGSGIFALAGTAAAGQTSMVRDIMSTPVINFLLDSPLGRDGAGPAIIVSFLMAGFSCGMAALCYAELASTIPVAGSAYTFAYATLGRLVAWIIGWDLILEYGVGTVAVAVGWSGYFVHFFHGVTGGKVPLWLTSDTTTALSRIEHMPPSYEPLYSSNTLPQLFGQPIALNIPALAIVLALTTLLVIGIKESSAANKFMVIVKVSVVLFFLGVGAAYVNPQNWIPFAPSGLAGIMSGAAIVFFAFIGFDAVSTTAEEAKNPQRDMPIGILGSLAICTLLYLAVSAVLTGILPYKTYAGDAAPVATALASTGQPLAQMIVTTGAITGITSVLLVLLLGQSRIFMAMSRDGLLPGIFSKVHPRFKTPWVPTLLTGLVVGLFAMTMDIGQAAELTNIGTLAAFTLVCAGVIVLRKLEPNRDRPFKCPLVPVVPILGILSCLGLMLALPVVTWLRFIAWMALGLLIFFVYSNRSSTGNSVSRDS